MLNFVLGALLIFLVVTCVGSVYLNLFCDDEEES